eukprot:512150_1
MKQCPRKLTQFTRQCNNITIAVRNHQTISNKNTIVRTLPKNFFAYGTLRDDSNHPNAENLSGFESVSNSILYGYKIYTKTECRAPFAMPTNNINDFIVGRLIRFNDILFRNALANCDECEGYDINNTINNNEKSNKYARKIVNCYHCLDNDVNISELNKMDVSLLEKEEAIVYCMIIGIHIERRILKQCYQVPNGNWLDRALIHDNPKKYLVDSTEINGLSVNI